MTAARIYAVGEDGELTMDTLPETAFVKTFSNDAQVTDSAPSMSAYMTGVKMNNEVVAMSSDTIAIPPVADANGNKLGNNCGSGNGTAVSSLAEISKRQGLSVGVVTTTRITHATPAASSAHICHRDLENDIAAAMVPGGAGYNTKLGKTGLDVVLGGGAQFFRTKAEGGKRADGRDLIAEMKTNGYAYASNASELNSIDPARTSRLLGLFTSSHMSYDLDRSATNEPSLAEMTSKAMDVLAYNNPKGYFHNYNCCNYTKVDYIRYHNYCNKDYSHNYSRNCFRYNNHYYIRNYYYSIRYYMSSLYRSQNCCWDYSKNYNFHKYCFRSN